MGSWYQPRRTARKPRTPQRITRRPTPAPGGRDLAFESTIGAPKRDNIHIHEGVTRDQFVAKRTERELGKQIEALPGETLIELGQRARDSWGIGRLAFQNALFSNHVFEGGELVKIAKLEPYDPGAP